MKLNRMICPNCGHETLTERTYTTCDACQTMFYAASSLDCNPQPSRPDTNVEHTLTVDDMLEGGTFR